MTQPPDIRSFRRTFGRFATGVTVITAMNDGDVHGMTANAVTSVSLDPLLVLVCIDRRAHLHTILHRTDRFAINILSSAQEDLSRHFAHQPGPPVEPVFATLDGVPILPDTLGTVVCSVSQVLDGGDHVIVIGRVDALMEVVGGEPLLYFGGGYREIAPVPEPLQPVAVYPRLKTTA